jgi:hypothetical protein
MEINIKEIIALIPNYGISILVIWMGFKLFEEVNKQIIAIKDSLTQINNTLAKFITLLELIVYDNRGKDNE